MEALPCSCTLAEAVACVPTYAFVRSPPKHDCAAGVLVRKPSAKNHLRFWQPARADRWKTLRNAGSGRVIVGIAWQRSGMLRHGDGLLLIPTHGPPGSARSPASRAPPAAAR
eukprot:3578053-Alexandrium_andersonii.AAC.1